MNVFHYSNKFLKKNGVGSCLYSITKSSGVTIHTATTILSTKGGAVYSVPSFCSYPIKQPIKQEASLKEKTLFFALYLKTFNPQGFYNLKKHSLNHYYDKLQLNTLISYNTFAKLFRNALKLNAFKLVSKLTGTIQLKNKQALFDLLNVNFNVKKINRYFNLLTEKIQKTTFKEYIKNIVQSLMLLHFSQQQYKLQKNIYIKEFSETLLKDNSKKQLKKEDYIFAKKMYKIAKKKGISVSDYLIELSKNNENIVTGSRFLSIKIGFSHNFINNLLNDLKERGFLNRKVIYNYINKFAIPFIKDAFYSPTNDCGIQVIGSEITLNIE